MTHKIAMRRALAEDGVPQPPFAAVRIARRGPPRRSRTVGFPAVLKPADSGGQRGVFRIETEDDLERAPATRRSPSRRPARRSSRGSSTGSR